MSDSKNNGIGIVGVLTTVLVVNKLTHAGDIADWSWWWVLSPLWISLGLAILIGAIGGLVLGVSKGLDRIADKKDEKTRAARLRKL